MVALGKSCPHAGTRLCGRSRNSRFRESSRIANPSYSILTLERLLAAGTGPLAFLIGADAFAEIRTWRRWQDVIRSVEFIVVTRPGCVTTTLRLAQSCMNSAV